MAKFLSTSSWRKPYSLSCLVSRGCPQALARGHSLYIQSQQQNICLPPLSFPIDINCEISSSSKDSDSYTELTRVFQRKL